MSGQSEVYRYSAACTGRLARLASRSYTATPDLHDRCRHGAGDTHNRRRQLARGHR